MVVIESRVQANTQADSWAAVSFTAQTSGTKVMLGNCRADYRSCEEDEVVIEMMMTVIMMTDEFIMQACLQMCFMQLHRKLGHFAY